MKDNEGWQSEACTHKRCRTTLDAGAGNQFRDLEGHEQRYCWKHWVEYAVASTTRKGEEDLAPDHLSDRSPT